jgi:hypothetical protein
MWHGSLQRWRAKETEIVYSYAKFDKYENNSSEILLKVGGMIQ